jgi:cell shape-determining protein MreC
MLGRKQSGSYVLATILVKPGRSLYDTVVIDAGSEEGIRPEALVYAYQTVPVGTVTAVSAHSATVTLFTTSGQKTNGRIEGKNIDVELVGRGGGNFELKVPRDVTLMPDMTVLLPGLRTSVVAVVAKSITDARDPVQTFLLTSPVNINELNSVEVAR